MTLVCSICCNKRSNIDCVSNVCYFCLKCYNSNNKKNSKKLNKSHIYSLILNNNQNMVYSFVEWGKAKEMGKILVLGFDTSFENSKHVKYLMQDSIHSFKHLSDNIKNYVLQSHPAIKMSYLDYETHLTNYIHTI